MNWLHKTNTFISKIEGIAVSSLLGVMILMAFIQVLLRNFLQSGVPWADIFLRNLVLWVCFLGASLSTYEKKHITIDIVGRLLGPKAKILAVFLVNMASSIVCGLLTAAALQFLWDEQKGGGFLFGEIPAWYFLTIIPPALALMGMRFFFFSLEPFFEKK